MGSECVTVNACEHFIIQVEACACRLSRTCPGAKVPLSEALWRDFINSFGVTTNGGTLTLGLAGLPPSYSVPQLSSPGCMLVGKACKLLILGKHVVRPESPEDSTAITCSKRRTSRLPSYSGVNVHARTSSHCRAPSHR